MVTSRRFERIHEVLIRRQRDLTLILSNIHDPHNVSAIYRSCDAFGVSRVCLYYTGTAFPPLGKKTSASARKWVESARFREAQPMVDGLRAQGYQVLATCFEKYSKPLPEVDLTRPTAIIVGNEHRGVEPELMRLADGGVYIPMQGMIQSLNVSVASAVILYEAWRQRRAKGMFDSPSYSPEELDELVSQWVAK